MTRLLQTITLFILGYAIGFYAIAPWITHGPVIMTFTH